jgi:uncharacterized protein YhbP (UPF0306 family)
VTDGDWRPTGNAPPTPLDDPAVLEILETSTLALATAGAGSPPFATPVFFAVDDDLGLVFFSDRETLHVRQAMEQPSAAAAIYPATSDWLEIRGLQVAGSVERIDAGPAWERAWTTYVRKFPFVSELRPLVEASWLLVLRASWVRLIDNRRGFGFKREWLRGPDFEEAKAANSER